MREILRLAARAPSGGNLQPWRVHALAGAALEDLKARIRPHAPTNHELLVKHPVRIAARRLKHVHRGEHAAERAATRAP